MCDIKTQIQELTMHSAMVLTLRKAAARAPWVIRYRACVEDMLAHSAEESIVLPEKVHKYLLAAWQWSSSVLAAPARSLNPHSCPGPARVETRDVRSMQLARSQYRKEIPVRTTPGKSNMPRSVSGDLSCDGVKSKVPWASCSKMNTWLTRRMGETSTA